MDGLCGFDFNRGGNSGGQSWWMIIDEPISSGNVCSNISGQFDNYLGEFVDDNCKTSIKKGTLIPCNCKFSSSQTGINYNYDYIYVNDYLITFFMIIYELKILNFLKFLKFLKKVCVFPD